MKQSYIKAPVKEPNKEEVPAVNSFFDYTE